ncbi:nucleotide sugar dehydrogenase [Chloroflexota bacterium]
MFDYDICVIGGCGRIGLPIAIAMADKGKKVVVYDLDKTRLEQVRQGIMPFREEGCDELLRRVVNKNLIATEDPALISRCKFVVVTIGTPVEEHLNPQYGNMVRFFQDLLPYLAAGQYIILRSTVYPGTAERVDSFLKEKGAGVHLTFCPERLAEGVALAELQSLPQIVSAFDEEGATVVSELFRTLTEDIVYLEPLEAELAKLFSNTWRYIQFSIANQLYMLTDRVGLDYYKIYDAVTYKYPRTQGIPRPGFAAGPCLFKDTLQLSSFSNNSFFLGHSAMLVNEGLPNYLVQQLKDKTNLKEKRVGILGMAYKANSDDERDSLSFKLKRLLEIAAKEVYCTDVYVKRDYFISAEELIRRADIIIVAAPHDEYRDLNIGGDKMLVDVWNFYNK